MRMELSDETRTGIVLTWTAYKSKEIVRTLKHLCSYMENANEPNTGFLKTF